MATRLLLTRVPRAFICINYYVYITLIHIFYVGQANEKSDSDSDSSPARHSQTLHAIPALIIAGNDIHVAFQ